MTILCWILKHPSNPVSRAYRGLYELGNGRKELLKMQNEGYIKILKLGRICHAVVTKKGKIYIDKLRSELYEVRE